MKCPCIYFTQTHPEMALSRKAVRANSFVETLVTGLLVSPLYCTVFVCVCVSMCLYHCFFIYCTYEPISGGNLRFRMFVSVQTCIEHTHRNTKTFIFLTFSYWNMFTCIFLFYQTLHRFITQLQFKAKSCFKDQNYVHMCTLDNTQIQKSTFI